MNKFAKRVLNSGKLHRNCLVIGTGFGHLENLAKSLNTVFVINDSNRDLRRRNIVYKSDFTGLSTIREIDFIFIDYDQYPNLQKLQPVLQNNKAIIFIEGEVVWPVNEYKYLRSQGYSHIDLLKGMQKWVPT